MRSHTPNRDQRMNICGGTFAGSWHASTRGSSTAHCSSVSNNTPSTKGVEPQYRPGVQALPKPGSARARRRRAAFPRRHGFRTRGVECHEVEDSAFWRLSFYHDGRFPDLRAVVDHYRRFRRLGLAEKEMRSLIEYLKSL